MSRNDDDGSEPLDVEREDGGYYDPRPMRSHRGSTTTVEGANRIVWGIAAALGMAGLALFSWNLIATIQVSNDIRDSKVAMYQEFGKVNVELVKVNAKLDMGAQEIADLKDRVAQLESKQRGR